MQPSLWKYLIYRHVLSFDLYPPIPSLKKLPLSALICESIVYVVHLNLISVSSVRSQWQIEWGAMTWFNSRYWIFGQHTTYPSVVYEGTTEKTTEKFFYQILGRSRCCFTSFALNSVYLIWSPKTGRRRWDRFTRGLPQPPPHIEG